jgi:Na+-driven multidrug efflux pump
MVTAVVIGVILSLAVFVLFTPILGFLRADGELSGYYFTDYYRIMLFTYPLMVLGTILGMFIRVNGKPQLCMLVSIAGCILK